MAIRNSYNFREVHDKVTTSGVVGANRLRGLAEEGYGLVINLLPDDSEYAVPDEREIVEGLGVDYVHIPVDFHQPQEADYERFAQAMNAAGGGKVHIHCAANYRVSAFYAIYATRQGLWTANDAEAFVSDIWNPADFPEWGEFMKRMQGRAE